MARPSIEVRILDDEHAAGSDPLPHAAKDRHGLAHVVQDEAREDGIVRGRFVPIVEVHRTEQDVGHAIRCRGVARKVQLHFVHIDPDDLSRGDDPGDLECNLASATSQIGNLHARTQAGTGEECRRVRPPIPGEELERVRSQAGRPVSHSAPQAGLSTKVAKRLGSSASLCAPDRWY